MVFFSRLLLDAALFCTVATATNLYVAATNGNLTTLSLTGKGNSSNLAISSWTRECSTNPAALNLDSQNRILYCMDRGDNTAINGTLNSFRIGAAGNLTRLSRAAVPSSGVWASFFGSGSNKGIATVSYNRSAIAVLRVNSDGGLQSPLQVLYPTIPRPGPVTLRQSLSYLHQVQVDPTGQYLIMNDLGGDAVYAYTFDSETLAPITLVSTLRTDPGVGPRHSTFKTTAGSSNTYYILVGELSQKVYTYAITYTSDGLSWAKVYEIPALGWAGERPAQTAPTSGIELTPDGNFVIVSNRDISFRSRNGTSDTLSTFRVAADGTLELIQLWPSGGYSPRQFSLNKRGDKLAVGHQLNFTVMVFDRDVESGRIVGQAASITLSSAVVSTIWDE